MKKNAQYVGIDDKYVPENETYVDNTLNSEIKGVLKDGVESAKNYLSKDENKQKIKNTGKKVLRVGKGIGIAYLSFLAFVFLIFIFIFIIIISGFFKVNSSFDNVKNSVDSSINEEVSSIN